MQPTTQRRLLKLCGFIVGAGIAFFVNLLQGRDAKSQSKRELLEQTKVDCENLTKTAELEKKEKLLQLQSKFESDNQKVKDEVRKREVELDKREASIKQSSDDLRKQEKFVENNQRKLAEKTEDVQRKSDQFTKLIQQQQADLQRVTGMSSEEAKKQLLSVLEHEALGRNGVGYSPSMRNDSTKIVQQKSQDILLTAIERYASSHTSESTTSTVDIPNDEMKGRIIGREGRNIRAFKACGSFDHRRYCRSGYR